MQTQKNYEPPKLLIIVLREGEVLIACAKSPDDAQHCLNRYGHIGNS
jgi:hypothetical protein